MNKLFFVIILIGYLCINNAKANDLVSIGESPVYTVDGSLVFPKNYREWVFLSSGLDMSYNPKAVSSKAPVFDNVFVNSSSYAYFVEKGFWPDKTQLVLEHRTSASKTTINHRGSFQTPEVFGLEVHVKDTSKFKNGWAFFTLENGENAKLVPEKEDCYSCHMAHAAVDTTFVQFYPTLISIAEKYSTFSENYMKESGKK